MSGWAETVKINRDGVSERYESVVNVWCVDSTDCKVGRLDLYEFDEPLDYPGSLAQREKHTNDFSFVYVTPTELRAIAEACTKIADALDQCNGPDFDYPKM